MRREEPCQAKFPAGWLADYRGGRWNFLSGMGGSIAFTLLFSIAGGLPLFTLAWIGNRAVQSLGWAGMVKVTSRWFSFAAYGTVMGVISLSYLFGDAAARQFLATLIAHGVGWRGLFLWAAGVLGVLLIVNAILLRESPTALGFVEPPVNPDNLFGEEGQDARPSTGLGPFLATFGRSPAFWLVCGLSLCLTLLRETFNLWTPTYFTEALRLTPAEAARESALFPLFGGISVLLAGYLSDVLGRRGRAGIVAVGLALTTAALVTLALADPSHGTVWLVAAVAFFLLGPYSYFAGAISLDFGGRQGSATASGFIDGVGYLGGAVSGGVASLAERVGWGGAFGALATVSAVAWIGALAYLVGHRAEHDIE